MNKNKKKPILEVRLDMLLELGFAFEGVPLNKLDRLKQKDGIITKKVKPDGRIYQIEKRSGKYYGRILYQNKKGI